jgi:hypothetical protein
LYQMKQMPNVLKVVDGVLSMQNGGDVQEYLRSRPLANSDAVVLLTREDAQRLLEDATKWRFKQLSDDERFAFAA